MAICQDDTVQTEEQAKAALAKHQELTGLDPATIVFLVQLGLALWKWFKARRATKLQLEAGMIEGELEIDFDLDDE